MTYHTVSLEERFLHASFLETRALLLILWFAQDPWLQDIDEFAKCFFTSMYLLCWNLCGSSFPWNLKFNRKQINSIKNLYFVLMASSCKHT